MKKTFTDEQIVGILRGFEASGLTIKEYCRQSDNGSEFIAQAVNNRLTENRVKPLFMEPGKPWQNGKGDAF